MSDPASAPDPNRPEPGAGDPGRACEQWLDQKGRQLDQAMKRLPAPVSAAGDVLCGGVLVAGAWWLAARLGWLAAGPGAGDLALLAAAIFVLSLACRLVARRFRQQPP